jgi:UDP-N-acetylglucosamine 2-epimerase (non-hydrolysing)
MMKVLSIVGTRPEAIKMAPVIKALKCYPNCISSKVVVTAQHREMLDQVLHLFDIRPEYDLNVMSQNQTPNQVAAAVLSRLGPVLERQQPEWVLVQGDTTTTMAAATAALYTGIRVGHVEAGLRTYDKWNPFPEEINRRLVSLVADLHFAPTELARHNLTQEGVRPEKIFVTGNPVVDSLRWVVNLPLKEGVMREVLPKEPHVRVILLTAHRRENFTQGLVNICDVIRQLCRRYGNAIRFIYPVHPNPNILRTVMTLLGDQAQVKLLPPLSYLSLVQIMARSYLIMTDSGGIQEEAPVLGKPVLVLRETTERPEALAAGSARLVGTDPAKIMQSFTELWDSDVIYRQMTRALNLYGDGQSAKRIVQALLGQQVHEFLSCDNHLSPQK